MCSDISDKVRNVYSDVRDNTERVLEQISMVDQDVFLFDDTIRDNIRHARPNATDEEIEANCDSFIRKMEKGYSFKEVMGQAIRAINAYLRPGQAFRAR